MLIILDESRESRGGGRSRGRPREGRGYRENRTATDDRHSKSGVTYVAYTVYICLRH
jgi:hypothetical protein